MTPDPRDLEWYGRELERHARRASVALAQRDALERDREDLRCELLALVRAWTSPENDPDRAGALELAADELRAVCRSAGLELEARPLPRPPENA
jgi:hypothetical protein